MLIRRRRRRARLEDELADIGMTLDGGDVVYDLDGNDIANDKS